MNKRIDPQLLNRLAEKYEPAMRDAFLRSIEGVKDRAKLNEIIAAIVALNYDELLRLVEVDRVDMRAVERMVLDTFEGGGFETAKAIQRAAPRSLQLTIRFDARNPRAESWIAERSSTLITGIIDDQRQMIRTALYEGLQKGQAPRTIALDLVGRINKRTGHREGGIIGLTSRQEEWQRNYIAELSSDDPKLLRRAITRELRDKRFDRTIAKAIREGKPIPAKLQNKMVLAYRNKSLRHRAESIARTETLEALNASNHEAYQQAVDSGQIREQSIRRFARTAGDERVRHEHVQIPGMNPNGVGLNEPFQTPDGPMMNAPFGVACRCLVETRVDFIGEALNG